MTAPLGAIVGLYYDARREVRAGDALRTASGRCYQVVSVRRQARGKHVGRWHLRCLVVDELPAGTLVHPLRWYARGRR